MRFLSTKKHLENREAGLGIIGLFILVVVASAVSARWYLGSEKTSEYLHAVGIHPHETIEFVKEKINKRVDQLIEQWVNQESPSPPLPEPVPRHRDATNTSSSSLATPPASEHTNRDKAGSSGFQSAANRDAGEPNKKMDKAFPAPQSGGEKKIDSVASRWEEKAKNALESVKKGAQKQGEKFEQNLGIDQLREIIHQSNQSEGLNSASKDEKDKKQTPSPAAEQDDHPDQSGKKQR